MWKFRRIDELRQRYKLLFHSRRQEIQQDKREVLSLEKIKIAAIGYGNVGRKAVEAILIEPDMELAGIVEVPRNVEGIQAELGNSVLVVDSIKKLVDVDVAVLSVDSHVTSKMAIECLELGINTVDPYDNYSESFLEYRAKLDKIAKENNAVAVICAGWDPGTDGMIRAVMEIIIPRGLTYTNFGPGQSMSHSAVARSIEGVVDAFSLTLPKGAGLHKRMVYIQLAEGADFQRIEQTILNDHHFNHDETYVIPVKDVKSMVDSGHGVLLERKGRAGQIENHRTQYTMSIVNTAVTSQVMVSSARAAGRQKPGCYCLPEIAPVDFLYGDKDQLLKRLV